MTADERDLLNSKLQALVVNQKTHYSAAERYQKLNWSLGSFVVIVSTLSGAFTFADVQQFYDWVPLLLSGASVFSAIVASIVTFSSFSDSAARHKLAGTRYGKLVRRVEGWLVSDGSGDWEELFQELLEEWADVSDSAPITYFRARTMLDDS